jgi:hypothetical protein
MTWNLTEIDFFHNHNSLSCDVYEETNGWKNERFLKADGDGNGGNIKYGSFILCTLNRKLHYLSYIYIYLRTGFGSYKAPTPAWFLQ